MVKFNSTHGHINIREIGKPVKKETDLMGRPAFTFRHTVKITFNDKSTQFGFSTSISDFESGKVKMSDEDLHYALSYFLEDGISSIEGYENFCSELGYEMWADDPDEADRATGYDKKSLKIYNACERERIQAERIGITEDMAYDIIQEIRDAGYE